MEKRYVLGGRARVCGCVVRCKSVSIVLVEVYLCTGEGLSERNVAIIQWVVELVKASGLPGVVCGDFQNTAAELAGVQMIMSAGMELVSNDEVPTCFGRTPRAIDHCIVSSTFRPAITAVAVQPSVRKSHAALVISVLQRPMIVEGLQPCAHPAWPPPPGGEALQEDMAAWAEV